MNVLYVSYDGFEEPLVQSQVLPYLKKLASLYGHAFTLLTYDKARVRRKADLARELRHQGIRWVSLRYHKRPSLLATAYDILHGMSLVLWMFARQRFDIVHARGYVSAVIAYWCRVLYGIPFLFDMRGFFPEEKVDAGSWERDGFTFRMAKLFERRFFRTAAHIVTLTHSSVPVLREQTRAPVTVIPTCVDLDVFTEGVLKRSDDLLYAGSLGSWYDLDAMLAFFRRYKQRYPAARFIVYTHSPVQQTLPPDVIIRKGTRVDVARAARAARAGIMFIKPFFSKKASCPTKLGEYLASGLFTIANTGIGDVEQVLRKYRCGSLIKTSTIASYDAAVSALPRTTRASRCRTAAEEMFSLDKGADAYDLVYRGMIR